MAEITLYDLMMRLVGTKEIAGTKDNSFIKWCLELDGPPGMEIHDEIPNCSAVMNRLAWFLRLPRSKSWMARSWLNIGTPITLAEARPGFDIVILKRGGADQPGPEVLNAPGHVTLYAGMGPDSTHFQGLGANQGDQINVAPFLLDRILGVRRLA